MKKSQQRQPKGISPEHKAFALAFIDTNDRVKAYKAAGYKGTKETAHSEAYRILNIPHVKAFIEQVERENLQAAQIRQVDVLREYAAIAFSRPRNIGKWKGKTLILHDSALLSVFDEAAIASLKPVKGGGIAVTFHDKNKALHQLGLHLKMWKEPAAGPAGVIPVGVLDKILVYVPQFANAPDDDRNSPRKTG